MQTHQLPDTGQVVLAHPTCWEQAKVTAEELGMDWFLSEDASREFVYWVRVTPSVLWARPILAIPGEQEI